MEIIQGTKAKLGSTSDLFDAKNLLNDATQRILLPYIRETQCLLNKVIHQYDSNGQAYILPSIDLGFSYNTGRIAGGFTTGMIVNWNSSEPFVPIDMTIKECSGSVFKIDVPDESFFSYKNIDETLAELRRLGHKFSFTSGNHFISLYRDGKGSRYLVIHSGDDGYRDSNKGIYPSDKAWYWKKVLRVYNVDNGRYINYLIGSDAEKFIDIGLANRPNVACFHNCLCRMLLKDCGHVVEGNTYQHYGFHSKNTAVLGTGLVSENDIFPIFSNEGLPIIIVKPSKDMWSVIIDDERRFIIPHGWGQIIDDVKDLAICPSEATIKIIYGNYGHIQKIGYKSKLPKKLARIRELTNYSNFIRGKISFEACWNNNLYLDVVGILYPIASYSAELRKIHVWKGEASYEFG